MVDNLCRSRDPVQEQRALTLHLNPPALDAGTDAQFLAHCFAARWSQAEYDWYLRREFCALRPDRLLVTDDGEAVAGCGLAYRLLRTPDGALHAVSVVVAACTAPEARGQGHYARVLQAAVERSAARGCTGLLGFVTADNATGRGLRRRGALAVPAWYLVGTVSPQASVADLPRARPLRASTRWRARARAGLPALRDAATFHYPDDQAWRSQMVERPHAVRSLGIGRAGRAIVERVGDTDRLQWLDVGAEERARAIGSLAVHACEQGQKFFMYSSRPQDVGIARLLGLEVREGYMMALATSERHAHTVRSWGALAWHLQSGDRL